MFWRRSDAVRVAAVAAGLAGALALTACSSDSDSEDESAASPAPSAPSASASAGTGGDSGAAPVGRPPASWRAAGWRQPAARPSRWWSPASKAALFATGGTVCSGTAGEEAGMRMIRLKCTDGSKDRATGMVDSVGKGQLKVTWEGGLGAETYTKAGGRQAADGAADGGPG